LYVEHAVSGDRTSAHPLVSIIVPAYNAASFLDQAIGSALAQTLTDLELVVSDDASEDQTLTLARAWAHRDCRVRVHAQPRNLGMNPHWNWLLGQARGRWLLKLDADDALRADCLEGLLAGLARHPGCRIAACRTLDCDANLVPQASYAGERAFLRAGLDPLHELLLPGHIWLATMHREGYQLWHSDALLLERSLLEDLGGWDPRLGGTTDTDLLHRLLERNEPVLHLPHVGPLYRRHGQSISAELARHGWREVETLTGSCWSFARLHAQGALRDPVRWARWTLHWWRLREVLAAGDAGLPRGLREVGAGRLLEEARPPCHVRWLGGSYDAASCLRRRVWAFVGRSSE
jgi:hypothetical protein